MAYNNLSHVSSFFLFFSFHEFQTVFRSDIIFFSPSFSPPITICFRYHNGNDEAEGMLRGFGHTGFLCDDLDAACDYMERKGVIFKKKPSEGSMRGE